MISAIVCVDKNLGIGYQGNLLMSIPEDMRFFTEKTKHNVVIMGRKTYDSLPSKPLPYRTNIVVTSKIDKMRMVDENGTVFVSMDFIKVFLSTLSPESPIDYYIIGGGQIYEELLPYCNKVYVTEINRKFENVDTYFPDLSKHNDWWMVENGEAKIHIGTIYRFNTYSKVDFEITGVEKDAFEPNRDRVQLAINGINGQENAEINIATHTYSNGRECTVYDTLYRPLYYSENANKVIEKLKEYQARNQEEVFEH